MTTYAGSEPLEPFSVPAKILKRSGGESESPAQARHDPEQTGSNLPFHELETPLGRVAGGIVLACAWVLVEANPACAWVGVLLLLGATLYRLDARQRRIAVAPVTFASLLLFRQMTQLWVNESVLTAAPVFQRPPVAPHTLPAPWLPLFFAVCLFYMPRYETVTGKIFLINSVLLLVSGLLPGYGFEAIFLTTQYFLFMAIAVGLAVDLTRHGFRP